MNNNDEKVRFDCVVLKITEIEEKEGEKYQLFKVKTSISEELILFVKSEFLLDRVDFVKRYSRLYVVGKKSNFDGDPVIEVEIVTMTKQ